MSRKVKEDMTFKNNEQEIFSKKNKGYNPSEDLHLQNIDCSLKNMEKEFGKSSREIAEVFCLVSGRLPKVREYLMFER